MRAGARLKVALFACLLAVGLLGACGGDEGGGENRQATPAAYVGQVGDSALFLALARRGDSMIGFATDGRRIAKWFQGPLADPVELMAADGDVLTASLGSNAATGTFTIGGRAHRFTLRPAVGSAGLYRAEGAAVGATQLTGWIVLPDGRQKGVTLVGRARRPAPRLLRFAAGA